MNVRRVKTINRILSVLLTVVMIMGMLPLPVFAATPSELTTDIAKSFVAKEKQEFKLFVKANDDVGKKATGELEITDADGNVVSKDDITVEYQEPETAQWETFSGKFGGFEGFTLQEEDAEINFSVTFNKVGNYKLNASLYERPDGGELCNLEKTVTVQRKKSTVTTDISQKEFKSGKPTTFTVTTVPNDDSGNMVECEFVIMDDEFVPYSNRIAEIEYLDNKTWKSIKSGDKYVLSGYKIDNIPKDFRITFESSINCYVKVIIRKAPNENLCSTGEQLVRVTTDHTIKAKITNQEKEAGKITLNGEEKSELTVLKDSDVYLVVTSGKGYQIGSIMIDGFPITLKDKTEYRATITMTEDTEVIVTFVKIYTLKVISNEDGEVVIKDGDDNVITDPPHTGGEVKVVKEDGTKLIITATPKDTFRVSKVVKSTETEKKTVMEDNESPYNKYDRNNPYVLELGKLDNDYTVEITFEPFIYEFSHDVVGDGIIRHEKNIINYNDSITFTLFPNENQRVGALMINNKPIIDYPGAFYSQKDDESTVVEIKGVKEDLRLYARFIVKNAFSLSDVDFNREDAVNNYNESVYTFRKDATVTFLPENEVRINGKKINHLTETTVIKMLEINDPYVTDLTTFGINWSPVELPEGGLKIVFDETAPNEVEFTPDKPNENGYYNSELININLTVVDPNIKIEDKEEACSYSGIERIEYWVTDDVDRKNITQGKGYVNGDEVSDGILYQCDGYYSSQSITAPFGVKITETSNNSDDVVVHVRITDRAGNRHETELPLKINITQPKIHVSVDGELHKEAETGYYNTSRTARIQIIDRNSCFDESKVSILIEATDGKNDTVPVSKPAMMSEWAHDGDTHTATIQFDTDANYYWEMSYTNRAGVQNEDIITSGVDPFIFTVDKVAPTAEISVEKSVWNQLLTSLTFGLYKKYEVTAVAEASDSISPIKDIWYYKSNKDVILTKEELISLYDDGSFTKEPITVGGDEQFAVYARITDYAGNTLYISTDGVIVDCTQTIIRLTPDKANRNGLYNRDVNIGIDIKEADADTDSYSGIKTVDYKVIRDGDTDHPTQAGNLYKFDIENPAKAQLKREWTGNITVNSEKNNSDNVRIIVTVVDNAGNTSSEEVALAINKDKPTIEVTFADTANKIVEERGYFGAERTATIQIVDRASAFDTDAVSITAQAKNAGGSEAPLDVPAMLSDWTHNGNIHTATLAFTEDGNYNWSITYINKADLECKFEEVTTGDSITPYQFTVDKTDPVASIQVNKSIWDRLLTVLTFGLYDNTQAKVTASYKDETSPILVEYYKTSDSIIKTEKELDALYAKGDFSEYAEFTVDKDERFVVYLKVTDYAGNSIYINSDGYIVDKVESKIALMPDAPNANGFYNRNVNIKISVKESTPYSGIKTVEYWVEKDQVKTQTGNLYTFDIKNPVQSELKSSWSGNITVEAEKNNSSHVIAYVRAIDNAGNESIQSVPLDIDVSSPSVSLSFDNNKDNNGNSYFKEKRTAKLVVYERNNHFDAVAATKGIVIQAVDVKGNPINQAYVMSEWKTVIDSANPDATTHTATILFDKDANYTFAFAYTDKADNKNSVIDTGVSVAPYKFTVDTKAPTGGVTAQSDEGRTVDWNTLRDKLSFGFWSNSGISIRGTSDDETSPVVLVEYYKLVSRNASDGTKALEVADLNKIKDWTVFGSGFKILPNEQCTVYLKISDKAGNYTYISTNGLIVDSEKPIEEVIAPEITVFPEQPVNGLYNRDVKVAIKVVDPLTNGTYSGLQEVAYKVFNRSQSTTEPTQQGVLYSFGNADPEQNELLQAWEGSITVDSEKNNSNDVQIVISARDNSQNYSEKDAIVKIDITAPVINIRYDNNSADSGTLFKENRTATVVVTERNFRPEDVTITITNTERTVPANSSWTSNAGSGNEDNTTWTSQITYVADGDYTFTIAYTDLANNICNSINYSDGTVAGDKFTIDKTLPTIAVTYDNNNVANGNYYKESRTATVVINEHNFSPDRVQFEFTATDDGQNAALPTVEAWSHNGDIHTATIRYLNEAKYTFDVSMTDQAGNAADDFEMQTFFVDKTAPELLISGIADQSANSGDIIPVISYSDTNWDESSAVITLTGAKRKNVKIEGSYEDQHNGRIFTFDNFEERMEVDDIYTLTARLTDMAGNVTEKTITFSANRFGSTYSLSDATQNINEKYVTTPVDIVITETNPNRLKDIKITIFKNNTTLVLKENEDYKVDIEGGEGNWYKYTYTIFNSNFKDDAVYRIAHHSKDEAGNIAENTLDTKLTSVQFGVDKTLPTINIRNLENGITYPLEQMSVEFSANDNLLLESVKVFLDNYDSEYKSWSGEELAKLVADGMKFTFDISGDSNEAHKIRIVALDAAGNEYADERNDFYVTTNLFVRYYNNKPLFFGSIAGTILLAAGIVVFILWKRRKREDNSN